MKYLNLFKSRILLFIFLILVISVFVIAVNRGVKSKAEYINLNDGWQCLAGNNPDDEVFEKVMQSNGWKAWKRKESYWNLERKKLLLSIIGDNTRG